MEWIFVGFAIVVLGAAGVAFWFWHKAESRAAQNDKRITELQTKLDNETAHHCTAEKERDEWRKKCDDEQAAKNTARIESATAMTRADEKQKAADKLRAENEALREQTTSNAADIAKLNNELKNVQKHADEKVASLKEVRESMEAEFKNLSQNILEEKGKKFDENSQKLLIPLRDNLQEFRKRMDDVHDQQTREIAGLQKNTAQVTEVVSTLALALKGDSKTQGDWGEVALATLLEKSGLREGEEYKTQAAMRGEDGNMLRPDVVINLPENKHLIIDSKVSLRDYHSAIVAEDDNSQKTALISHVEAVKNHVSSLSGKHYHRARDVNTPDFVFMFMPIEPAFFAALKESPSLFSDAYDKNIILCAPTTLMATLRVVERLWRLERQNQNAQEIAEQGGKLYDKFVLFLDSMEEIDKAINSARTSYDKAYKQIESSKGNLIGRVEKLRELGVNPKKRLPAFGAEDDEK